MGIVQGYIDYIALVFPANKEEDIDKQKELLGTTWFPKYLCIYLEGKQVHFLVLLRCCNQATGQVNHAKICLGAGLMVLAESLPAGCYRLDCSREPQTCCPANLQKPG